MVATPTRPDPEPSGLGADRAVVRVGEAVGQMVGQMVGDVADDMVHVSGHGVGTGRRSETSTLGWTSWVDGGPLVVVRSSGRPVGSFVGSSSWRRA
jgi:hypothetical protein